VENKKNTQSVNQKREARSRDKLAKTQNYSSSSKKGGEISGTVSWENSM